MSEAGREEGSRREGGQASIYLLSCIRNGLTTNYNLYTVLHMDDCSTNKHCETDHLQNISGACMSGNLM